MINLAMLKVLPRCLTLVVLTTVATLYVGAIPCGCPARYGIALFFKIDYKIVDVKKKFKIEPASVGASLLLGTQKRITYNEPKLAV